MSGGAVTILYAWTRLANQPSATSTINGISSGSFSFNGDDLMGGESYDANGNTTATGGKTYAYDSENRLKSMNGGAVTLAYDGDGNRVAKTVNGVTTRYLVDDLNPTGYAQVVEESVNGAVQRSYTYGLLRIDVIQLVNNVSTLSFYGYDGFGNVRQLTNSTGAVTDAYEYDAFGNLLNKSGSTPNNYLYRGEQWDSDLNLYYLRARYYNPTTGRFTSRDPLDPRLRDANGIPTDPAYLHRYLYANGDPVNGSDPGGREDIITYADLNAMSAVTRFMLQKIACGVTGELFKEGEKLLGITGSLASLANWGFGVGCSIATGGGGIGSGN